MSTPGTRFHVSTPNAPGAIAVIDLVGDVTFALAALGADDVPVGRPVVRRLGELDEAVVVRWSEQRAQVLPHAGPHVVRAISSTLVEAGIAEASDVDPCELYPEAADAIEAHMLDALARAESPAAVSALLSQPSRWHDADWASIDVNEATKRSQELTRLIDAPVVVAVGPPNVGKSTLTNALAAEAVSIVADAPGTTRDHVGVSIELPTSFGGFVIHWIDAPGIRSGDQVSAIEAEAISIARDVVRGANLLLSCGDADHGFLPAASIEPPSATPVITVGLKADLARIEPCDLCVSGATGEGLDALGEMIRRTLISDDAMRWDGPWHFHPALDWPGSPRG